MCRLVYFHGPALIVFVLASEGWLLVEMIITHYCSVHTYIILHLLFTCKHILVKLLCQC